jgi:hypothetical protein
MSGFERCSSLKRRVRSPMQNRTIGVQVSAMICNTCLAGYCGSYSGSATSDRVFVFRVIQQSPFSDYLLVGYLVSTANDDARERPFMHDVLETGTQQTNSLVVEEDEQFNRRLQARWRSLVTCGSALLFFSPPRLRYVWAGRFTLCGINFSPYRFHTKFHTKCKLFTVNPRSCASYLAMD